MMQETLTQETTSDVEIRRFSVDIPLVEKGDHFAAWEQPQLFSEEIRAAFRSLR